MGPKAVPERSSIPKLPLFSMAPPPHDAAEPSGTLTPPLQTSASVPFRWEEQPGKPRPSTDLILHHPTRPGRCLELPPRLAVVVDPVVSLTKTPSPTTVLDGPTGVDAAAGGKSVFASSSFRFPREQRRRVGQRQGSFDSSSCSGGWSPGDESGGGHQLLLPGEKQAQQKGSGGLFGSFRLRGTHKTKGSGIPVVGGSFVISPTSTSSVDTGFFEEVVEKKGKRVRRKGSFSSLSHVTRSHFWASIYSGIKQVVPWKKKCKKEGFTT